MSGADLLAAEHGRERTSRSPSAPPAIRFDRNELAGAFGDLGTDLPLLVGIVIATGMHATTAFVVFGALQIMSGFVYRLPMPVQPLKAMAAIAIATSIAPPMLAAGGLVVGIVMLLLAGSGSLDWIARTVPKAVVRGIQLGLGLQLGRLALTRFIPSMGMQGWIVAAVALLVVLALRGNRRVPAALVVLTGGFVLAAVTWPSATPLPFAVQLPTLPERWPTPSEFAQAALLLAVPQLALSLGNSVLATRQIVVDLFPERVAPSIRRIGTTYGVMNLVAAPLGGVPVCHGSGGIAGHFAFGARTGGSAVIYGSFLIVAGLCCVGSPEAFDRMFPGPVLGTLLLVEATTLLLLVRDLAQARFAMAIAIGCGLVAAFAPYGYAIALVAGTLAWYGGRATR